MVCRLFVGGLIITSTVVASYLKLYLLLIIFIVFTWQCPAGPLLFNKWSSDRRVETYAGRVEALLIDNRVQSVGQTDTKSLLYFFSLWMRPA